MLVDISRLAEIKRILGVCLLISSLPGNALRMLVDIARLKEIYRILGKFFLYQVYQAVL